MPRRTNLRPSVKRFIGRARELARVDELFGAGERLVSLVGLAGIGKTRVALRAIERSWERLDGGAWFCDLTEARTGDDVLREVAHALDATVAEVDARLAAAEQILIVLDNCEQVADDVAARVDGWLADAPGVRVLATSRERLRLAGEAVVEVGPLPEDEARELFADRARRVAAEGYAADGAGREAIAEIVRRLDGMPLAIELAAARAGVLAPAELLARLERRFDLLQSHARGVSERHRTLRAALDWSWELLEPWERAGLAQLAAFRGGFSIDAADRVVRVQHLPGAPDVIGGLQWLRDKSLVWTDADGRFGLYLSVRDYAAERLAELGIEADAFRRHAAYYRELAAELGGDLAWVAREQNNLLVAFERAAGDSFADGVECLLALEPLRAARGPLAEYDGRLTEAIGAPAFATLGAGLRARALQARGRMRGLGGRIEESIADFEAALALAREAGERGLEGILLLRLGVLSNNAGRFDEARDYYDRALEFLRAVGDRHGEAQALANVAVIEGHRGRLAEARAAFGEAQAIYGELGDRHLHARTTGNLATLLQDEGRVDEAHVEYERAIEALRELGDRRDAACFLGFCGTLYQETGHLPEAEACYERAAAELDRVGDRPYAGQFVGYLATVAAARDDLVMAAERLADAEALLAGAGDAAASAATELHGAHLDLAFARRAAARGRPEEAAARRAAVAALVDRVAPDAAAPSQRVRVALRVLDRVRRGRAQTAPPVADAAPNDALVVGAGGAWFEPPSGERVELHRRHTLRRVLDKLAEHRAAHPGEALSLDALFRAGWPGERVARGAAGNRVRVALATLRKLGLRGHLLTGPDGYRLDPALAVVRETDD